jgi:hypothetical protein
LPCFSSLPIATQEFRAAPTTLCDAANPVNPPVVSQFECNNLKCARLAHHPAVHPGRPERQVCPAFQPFAAPLSNR